MVWTYEGKESDKDFKFKKYINLINSIFILFYLSNSWVNVSNWDLFSKVPVVSFYSLLSTLQGRRYFYVPLMEGVKILALLQSFKFVQVSKEIC